MEKIIQEGIPLIKEWIEVERQEFKNNNDFSELEKIVKEIENDKDYLHLQEKGGIKSLNSIFKHSFVHLVLGKWVGLFTE